MRYTQCIAVFLQVMFLVVVSYGQPEQKGFEHIERDELGCFYLVKEYTVTKFSSVWEKLAEYTDPQYSDISQLDVSDPLRIMVFVKDRNEVCFLDRSMSAISKPVSLSKGGLEEASAVCPASDGGLWVVDAFRQKLQLLNDNGSYLSEGASLPSLQKEGEYVFQSIIDTGTHIYMLVANKGLWIFDQAGNFQKSISCQGIRSMCVLESGFVYTDGTHLIRRNLNDPMGDTVFNSVTPVEDFVIQDERVFYLNGEGEVRGDR